MDCRLHFKDVVFVSAPWYLQDKALGLSQKK